MSDRQDDRQDDRNSQRYDSRRYEEQDGRYGGQPDGQVGDGQSDSRHADGQRGEQRDGQRGEQRDGQRDEQREELYDKLISRLDVAGKVRLLTGATLFTLWGQDDLGLAPLALSDGPTGVRGLRFTGGARGSLLPNATLLAAAWDEDAMHQVGQILAEEAARQRIHVVLGPTINLHRSPLGGRLFEAYSEDPLLTGRLAAAYVRGLQGRGIAACLKHLVGNESETERYTVDVRIDEATLREVYLLPFEIAVEDADPWAIMAAYNYVNGVLATEQDAVINGIVKGEWGWTGLVVSDWFATRSTAPAARAGLDLVMPGPHGPWGQALVDAVASGEVPEEVVDDHLRRLLRLADRVGGLGEPRAWPAALPEPTDEVRRAALVRLAAAGMTVLTNGGGVLPLAPGTRVALIGRHAVDTLLMGGGSAQVNPPHRVSVADGLAALLPDSLTVVDGVEVRERPTAARPGFVVDPVDGLPGMRVRLAAPDGTLLADEHVPETRRLVGFEDDFAAPVARATLTARIEHTGRVQVGVLGVGSWTLRVGEQRYEFDVPLTGIDLGELILHPPARTVELDVTGPAVIEAEARPLVEAEAEAEAGSAAAGTADDTGRAEGADTADGAGSAGDDSPGVAGMLGLVARPAPRDDRAVIAEAVAAARACEVAVVVVGLTDEQETEGRDKSTLALPGAQDELVEAVAAAAPRTVVVVNSASPVLMPWVDKVDAVLVAGLPGQEGGHAVAAALLGVHEPAGRLTTTWPAADGAAPAWSVTPVNGELTYTEGPFIGYRGYAAGRAPAPLFWFGSGLGYGSWEYTEARVDRSGEAPVVTVLLRNTSDRPSREVVQVYFRPADAAQPVRLVGWSGVHVEPGRSVTVTVPCDRRMWRRWDADARRWSRLDGGELLVARGLGDIRHRLPLA